MTRHVIRAGGGVILSPDSATVLLVHRPKYGDWSLPKGKALRMEEVEQAAIREVEEETGLRCRLGPELGHIAYHDREGRPKVARYWLMTPVSGTPGPANEVDEVRWFTLEEAVNAATRPAESRFLEEVARRVAAERPADELGTPAIAARE